VTCASRRPAVQDARPHGHASIVNEEEIRSNGNSSGSMAHVDALTVHVGECVRGRKHCQFNDLALFLLHANANSVHVR